jgi:DNA-binding beta-propeller fold protein YncE
VVKMVSIGWRQTKLWRIWTGAAAALALLLSGCHTTAVSTPGTTVTISPTATDVNVGATFTFTATVSTSSTNLSVNWEVNNIAGGNSTVGTIDSNGDYTAPTAVPTPNVVTVTAISQADTSEVASATVTIESGIAVTLTPATVSMGTGESIQLSGTVTGSATLTVTWSICSSSSVSSITTTTVACAPDTTGTMGSVTSNGVSNGVASAVYFAPATVPATNPITVQAASVADPNQFALSTITLQSAIDPTLTSIYPTTVAQGSLFTDVYIQGTNFLTTTQVNVNGQSVTSAQNLVEAAATGDSLRARIPTSFFSVPPATLTITAQRQNGAPQACAPTPSLCQMAVVAARPAVVSAIPNSSYQIQPPSSSTLVNIDGGFYGSNVAEDNPNQTATVNTNFDGQVVGSTFTPREISTTLNANNLSVPGLHQITVTNPSVTQPAVAPQTEAAVNFSIQPTSAASIDVGHLAVGTTPVSVAVNTATGIAVVVNNGSNNISLIDLTQSTPTLVPGGPIAVGNGPTGVAVDNVRNLAVVVNNTDESISVVNLSTRAVSTISTQIPAAPYAVGVNPITGIALVAFQATNIGALVDLTQSPPAFVGAVTLATGLKPQVAVMPSLNWGLSTPGGAGTFSIVNLAQTSSSTIAASGGAVRSTTSTTQSGPIASTVTITTTTAHTLLVGDAVLIQGVADPSFDGIFTVASVPSSTSFTYLENGPASTSGGGTAVYSAPLAVVGFGENVGGIAVNNETKQAIMTDPTSANPATTMSVLDQTVTSVSEDINPSVSPLGTGNTYVAVNQYTNIAVVVNPATNTAALIDPRTPLELSTIVLPGINPGAIAIDPGTNLAVIANSGGNDVTILSLVPTGSAVETPQLESVVLPVNRQLSTDMTLTSTTALPLTLIGKGFQSGAVARVDGFVLPPVGTVTDRQMSVVVPATLLTGPRRFAVDVLNPSGPPSNVEGFSVVQAVNLITPGCPSPAPMAVAIDDVLNLAEVADSGCGTLSLVDLATGQVVQNIDVGNNPQGVAAAPGFGTAVVSNRGDNTVTIVDTAQTNESTSTFSVGVQPIGVAISPLDGTTLVANSDASSDNVSLLTANIAATATSGSTGVGPNPVAVAIDPVDLIACVANAEGSSLSLLNMVDSPPSLITTLTGPNQPTGVVWDPVNDVFIATASLGNSVFEVDPITENLVSSRTGINPTAIAYNYNTSTLVTVNSLSNTISVLDVQTGLVQANMGIESALLGSIAIHPVTNVAAVADQANNRLLLIPLPR